MTSLGVGLYNHVLNGKPPIRVGVLPEIRRRRTDTSLFNPGTLAARFELVQRSAQIGRHRSIYLVATPVCDVCNAFCIQTTLECYNKTSSKP